MRAIKSFLIAGAILFGIILPAGAQSGCVYIAQGAVLTAVQWNQCFANKQDYLGFTPLSPSNLVGVLPITVTPSAGVVQIGLNFNSSLVLDGSNNLGINLSHSNTFLAAQTIDLGSGTSEPAADLGTGLSVYGADGANARNEVTAFGAAAVISLRSSLGTRGSPTTITPGTLIASYNVHGYDGTAWQANAYGAIHVYGQTSNWTSTSHPTELCLATTPTTASATNADNFCVNANGTAMLVGALTAPQVTAPAATSLVLNAPTGQTVQLAVNGSAITVQQNAAFLPTADNATALGGASNRWSAIFGVAETISTITSPATTNLALNVPSGQSILLTINGVQQASLAAGGVFSVGVPGSQSGSVIIASPTANAMTLVPAASASGTATILSGTYNLVGDTPTQTLTNKTIVSSTDVLGGVTMTLGSDAEGDLYYRHSGLLTRLPIGTAGQGLEVVGGIPSWQALSGTGTVTSVTMTGAGGLLLTGTCPSAITTVGTCQIAAPGGFLNVLRNASFSAWFHGCVAVACMITTAGGWCAEGVWVIPTGASVTCQQGGGGSNFSPYYHMNITGAASVTDVIVRFVVESNQSSTLTANTVTFQFSLFNTTGGTVTPTIQTKYANNGAPDNWGATVTDLAATNMQACTNTSTCREAYALNVSGNAVNGYEFNIDLGNNFSTNGKSVTILFFDARITPGVATGLVSNPAPPEFRDPESDIRWSERFYQTTYDNFVAPGTVTHTGMMGITGVTSGGSGSAGNSFKTTMRCDPSVSFWDGAGNASKTSFWTGAAWSDNQGSSPAVVAAGQNGFSFYNNGAANEQFHYAADCTVSGG